MLRERILAAFAAACVLAASVAVGVERKGITFGTGLGPGLTHGPLPGESAPGPGGPGTYFSIAFPQLELGYAPSNHLDIHFTTKWALYDFQGMGEDYQDFTDLITEGLGILLMPFAPIVYAAIPLIHSHSLIGAGATYYVRPQAPSLFFEAAAGPTPFKGGPIPGLYGGVGYEFSPHVALELGAMWGAAGVSRGLTQSDLLSISLTFNVLGY